METKQISKDFKKQSQLLEVWKRLLRNKGSIVGLITIILLILISIMAGFIVDYDNDVIKQDIPNRLQSPTSDHLFGTDEYGRDIFIRVIYGARISLFVGFLSTAISFVIGVIIGAISGFAGGKIDMLLMRIVDILLAIPSMLFAITIVAALGTSVPNLIIALSISGIPTFARVVRSSVLSVREMEYVEAAKAIGAKNLTIIFNDVLPNSMAPALVQATIRTANVILDIASLSFLGLGIQPPAPEWGSMLSSARTYIRDYSYIALFPGLAIMITILALNILGDGLRDALDPKLK